MEKTLMMPAYYNVMSQEEMTYTEGGATATQAILAAFVWPYGWYKGCIAARDFRKKCKNSSDWIDKGLEYFVADMEKSVTNLIYDISCAWSVAAVCATGIGILPTALIVFSKN